MYEIAINGDQSPLGPCMSHMVSLFLVFKWRIDHSMNIAPSPKLTPLFQAVKQAMGSSDGLDVEPVIEALSNNFLAVSHNTGSFIF